MLFRSTVKINAAHSQFSKVRYGVPQGSTLGPTLFLIYVNDMLQLDIDGSVVAFADDTMLLFNDKTWNGLKCKAERELGRIKKWLNYYLLTLNSNKTKYMTFTIDNRLQPSDFELTIHDCRPGSCTCPQLEKVKGIKYLGVFIDQFLRWDIHADNISGKLRKLLYIFKNLRNILDLPTIKTIYYALAHTVLSYGVIAWVE